MLPIRHNVFCCFGGYIFAFFNCFGGGGAFLFCFIFLFFVVFFFFWLGFFIVTDSS